MTIPSAETGLGGTYTFATGYNVDGSVNAASYPQTGDLPIETILYGYTDLDQPATLLDQFGTQAESSIVSDSQYDALAHATQYTSRGPHHDLPYDRRGRRPQADHQGLVLNGSTQ